MPRGCEHVYLLLAPSSISLLFPPPAFVSWVLLIRDVLSGCFCCRFLHFSLHRDRPRAGHAPLRSDGGSPRGDPGINVWHSSLLLRCEKQLLEPPPPTPPALLLSTLSFHPDLLRPLQRSKARVRSSLFLQCGNCLLGYVALFASCAMQESESSLGTLHKFRFLPPPFTRWMPRLKFTRIGR